MSTEANQTMAVIITITFAVRRPKVRICAKEEIVLICPCLNSSPSVFTCDYLLCNKEKSFSHHRQPKLIVTIGNYLPYKVLYFRFPIKSLIFFAKKQKSKKLKRKLTYHEFTLCLSLVCILGAVGAVFEGEI